MKSKNFRALATALTILVAITSLACGPDFPNNLLDGGDNAVLVAPEANFANELVRMNLVTSAFRAIPPEPGDETVLNEQIPGLLRQFRNSGHVDETIQVESNDLRAALKQAGTSINESQRIASAHLVEREKLRKFLATFGVWENSGAWTWDANGSHRGKPPTPAPVFPEIKIADQLPGEFADYFDGALSWNNPAIADKDVARASWEHLLARPEEDRKFKSTWAAFMLGKSWETENSAKAVQYFQQVRELAKRRFADSAGLAAASLGLEARICLEQKSFERAIELYLEQFAAGDATALNSLRFTTAAALKNGNPDSLAMLAANPKAQRVITAYLVSFQPPGYDPHIGNNITTRWLAAVESANVTDMESAEKLALAAYRANDMAGAQRWINRAPDSPVAQWLQAKLFLRNGKVDEAAALLAKVTRNFPAEPVGTNTPASFGENLSVNINPVWDSRLSAGQQAIGELGALHLARREYSQSLDALLRSGYWMDTAYVAERVLTTEELKNYVDENWPPVSPEQAAKEIVERHDGDFLMTNPRLHIRYLLARRLTRSNHSDQAQDYFPAQWQTQCAALTKYLKTGRDENLPAEERARALFAAAFITRTNGMELLGTEVEPDWAISCGNYQIGFSVSDRTNHNFQYLGATADEFHRAESNSPVPDERFHYRAKAGALGWEAAKLLPDNSELTARILCTAASWGGDFDFYKALISRCRNTIIGREAYRRGWFPRLDENGNLKPPRFQTLTPGTNIVVIRGDDLRDIADAVNRAGFALTVNDILAANPGLTAKELPIGRILQIPMLRRDDGSPAEASTEFPQAGKIYYIHDGETISSIARAVSKSGLLMTAEEILAANPGLEPKRIKIGSEVMIPVFTQ